MGGRMLTKGALVAATATVAPGICILRNRPLLRNNCRPALFHRLNTSKVELSNPGTLFFGRRSSCKPIIAMADAGNGTAKPVAPVLENAEDLINSVETFIFDCDGVIWKGDTLVDGVPETLDMLRARAKRLVFVTNNSTKSRKQYAKKFEALGLTVGEEEIFASSFAAAAYLESIDFPKEKKARRQKAGEKSLLSLSTILQAARANCLLAVPAFLYAINNYLKFIMQLYFNPATVKMLSNSKVLVIALLLKVIMRRRFSVMQWEALALLLIGITVNQLRSLPEGTTALGLPVATGAYIYTLIFVTVPSLASVYNEYALKSQFETSIYLQNLFLYGYGAIFNFLGIIVTTAFKGAGNFNILQGHSRATMLLIFNNAAQGILSSFFFKYADTILKKYSSTVATIFTGLASAALFGHTLTINFILGISIVFISMHQFFSSLSKPKEELHNGTFETLDTQHTHRSKESFINMTAGATEEASHSIAMADEREPLLPT